MPWWALGSGVAGLLFLPWLPVALRQTGYYPGLGSPQPAWALVLDSVNVLSIGIATMPVGNKTLSSALAVSIVRRSRDGLTDLAH